MTIVTHIFVEEVVSCGPEMLAQEWQLSVSGNGTAVHSDKGFRLVSKDKAARIRFHQEIKGVEPGSMVMLSADMACCNVDPGKKSWHMARLVLVQHDGVKNRYDYIHAVGMIFGSREFDHYRNVFTIGPDTLSLRVAGQLSLCTGTFELKNIRMVPVVRTTAHTWLSRALLLGWAMFGLYLVGGAVTGSCHRGVILKGVLIISFFAIIIGSGMPWEMKNEIVREASAQLQETNSFFDWNVSGILPKIGHFLFFSIFGIAMSLTAGQALWWSAPVNILLLAGGTELAQFFIEGRSPLIMDFFIDAGGGLLGFLMAWLFNASFPRVIESKISGA